MGTAERRTEIMRVLCRRRHETISNLADEFGVSTRTILRDNADHPDCSIEVDLVGKSEFDPQIFNVFGLHHQGELVTKRIIMYNDSACQMVLDKNIYLGYTDFELEVEYRKDSERKAQRLIENIAKHLVSAEHLTEINELLMRVGKGKSKSERFFERVKLITSQKGGSFYEINS